MIHILKQTFVDATQLNSQLQQTVQSSGDTNPAEDIDKAIEAVKTKVTGIAKIPGGSMKGIDNYEEKKRGLNHAITAITTSVNALNVDGTNTELGRWSEAIEKNLNKLTTALEKTAHYMDTHLTTLQTEKIDGELTQILLALNSLHIDEITNTGRIQNAINSVLALIKDLETVPQKVDEKRGEVEELMERLKNQLNGLIYDINQNIKNAFDALTTAISAVKHAYNHAYHTAMDAVQTLKHDLLYIAKNAFDSVTADVRKLFAEQKIADLSALKTVVERRCDDITATMDNDASRGIKRLLWNMDRHYANLSQMPIQIELKDASTYVNRYFDPLLKYVIDEVHPDVNNLDHVNDKFNVLIKHLTNENDSKIYNYDHTFTSLLSTLSSSLTSLHPSAFANPRHPELLDAVKKGLQGVVEQMERVYVNGYDGSDNVIMIGVNTKKVTDDGKNCAKIFFTILERLYRDMDKLRETCRTNSNKSQICLYDWDNNKKTRNDNPLGNWYSVAVMYCLLIKTRKMVS
ncbi:hypothetical protein, conserved [Babesia bigemina]|nr:hypothetical protein, conserved [Babesia bigemina]CDR71540.1 hypothetical protein, conserved [Babesia bigemina]|eukprot:XP_012770486.1 hypothetical protein, conserved [Babesia bigemina]